MDIGSRYMLTGPTYVHSVHLVLWACNIELKFWQREWWTYLYAHAYTAGTLRYKYVIYKSIYKGKYTNVTQVQHIPLTS